MIKGQNTQSHTCVSGWSWK